ncbi:transposase [Bradyrhizobium cenepequi]|uniref:transposase n=1 Tax=Bradyrhizobium cenepequi TaxID=2821403 RepID=UPI001CE25C4D|nr:transposase [Bradyrhizobium cenepequi]
MGQRIPLVCQDCANTKTAYRFCSNSSFLSAHVSEHVQTRWAISLPCCAMSMTT